MVAIAALARDCAENLKHNIMLIESLRERLGESYVVVYENDSKDATPGILRQWAQESSDVSVISETLSEGHFFSKKISSRFPEKSIARISKMVYLRNRLKELVFALGDPEYVIFIDIDLANFSVDGIVESIRTAPNDWSALFANSANQIVFGSKKKRMPLQHDIFAYCPIQKKVDDISTSQLKQLPLLFEARKLDKQIRKNKFFRCRSAFGGIGIYKAESIANVPYELSYSIEMEQDNLCRCEHLPFNDRIIKNGGSCYIASQMRTTYPQICKTGLKGQILFAFPFMCSLGRILFKKTDA